MYATERFVSLREPHPFSIYLLSAIQTKPQSMRQRLELRAMLRLSSFFANPRLFTGVTVCGVLCSPCVYRPGCCWPLLSDVCGIARGFHALAAWRLFSFSAPEFRRAALRQRNLAASRSMFTLIDVGFRVLFRAGRDQSVHLGRSVIFPKHSPIRRVPIVSFRTWALPSASGRPSRRGLGRILMIVG